MRRDAPGQASGASAGVTHVERPTLVWEKPDGTHVDIPLGMSQPVSLGRDAGNTIALESGFVSKHHATVRYDGGQYVVEDLRSANGTRLNGAPISISVLTPGDVVEVGDQVLRFVDRAEDRKKKGGAGGRGGGSAQEGGNLGKLARLGVVALIFGGGLFALMRMLFLGGSVASAPPPLDTGGPSGARWTLASTAPAPISTRAPIVQRIVDQARTAGVNANDALFDEARTQYGSGRLLEAARLFAAVVERDPTRDVAKMRLDEVKNELEGEIAKHRAEAERMMSQLRYDDSASEWEQVLLLLEPEDARVAPAKAGLDAARRQTRKH